MDRGLRTHGPDLVRAAGRIRHVTGDEILAHAHDGIGFEAMLLRRGRMNGQHRGGGKG